MISVVCGGEYFIKQAHKISLSDFHLLEIGQIGADVQLSLIVEIHRELVLVIVCFEILALAQFIALKLQSIHTFLGQILCVRFNQLLGVGQRFLLTESLAPQLSLHCVTFQRSVHCLVRNRLQYLARVFHNGIVSLLLLLLRFDHCLFKGQIMILWLSLMLHCAARVMMQKRRMGL